MLSHSVNCFAIERGTMTGVYGTSELELLKFK